MVTATKTLSKTQIIQRAAEEGNLTSKQVKSVIASIHTMIQEQMSKKGSGTFAFAGLLKITRVQKPATKAGTRPNPFKPGEMMTVKAKPARNVIKIRALKSLKEMC